jgi:hypothetical protein
MITSPEPFIGHEVDEGSPSGWTSALVEDATLPAGYDIMFCRHEATSTPIDQASPDRIDLG